MRRKNPKHNSRSARICLSFFFPLVFCSCQTKIHFFHVILSGQIIATSHDLGPQKVAEEGKSLYFREIEVGEILFNLARFCW